MKKYIFRRFFLGIFVFIGVVVVVFILTRIMPADPVGQWVGQTASIEQRERAFVELGLHLPIHTQFINYFSELVQGDLGISLRTKQPVLRELISCIPASLELVITAMLIAVFIGIPLGIYSAWKKDKFLDHFCRFFSVGAVSLPSFWVAMILQLIFFSMLRILPLGGRVSTMSGVMYDIPTITGFMTVDSLLAGNSIVFKDALVHIILPAISVSLYPMGIAARMTRSSLLEILQEDYITAARSYGLKESLILWRYALKNSLGTTVTVLSVSFGRTLIGTYLVEAIFSWPGLGSYLSGAIMSMDAPAIIGSVLFAAIMQVLLNLFADIIIAFDPRIRV